MSAWLCSQEHINCIVNAIGGDNRNFRLLLKENLRSLATRYPGRPFLREWKEEAMTYAFKPAKPGDMTQVVKCCDSFDYQACETEDYNQTKAKAFVEKVRNHAIMFGGKSNGPAYDAAQWSL
jgi:hypothetical protein